MAAESTSRIGSFVGELRRRRVFRVVAAYGIAAFAILQVSEPIQHGLRLPDWTLTLIVVGLGLGLPVSIALAWIYDLTVEGVRRSPPSAPGHGKALAALLAGSAVLAGGIATLALRSSPSLPPVDEQGRLVVAVADFGNETDDRELNGLSSMLITSLEQSRRLAVLTRARMLDVLRTATGAPVERIEERHARELADTAGARVLVTAAVHRFDQIYAIEIRVLDPARSAYLFTLGERGPGKASIPEMIDRLSGQLRLRLRETEREVASSRVRVGEALTPNLDAYEHYFRGVQHQETSRYEPAIVEYRKATAIDPSFALAHYRTAYAGFFANLDAKVIRDEMAAAMRNVDRVPDKEALLIRAWNEFPAGDEAQAQALYARAIAAYPDDKQIAFMAGEHLIHLGRMQASLPYFERAVALDPTWEWARWHIVDDLLYLGKWRDGLARTRRWAAEKPDGDTLKWLSRALTANGEAVEAEAAARRAVEAADRAGPWNIAPYWARFALVDALIYQERYGDAEGVLRPLVAASVAPSARSRAQAVLAEVLSYQGRRAEALRTIELISGEGASATRRLGLRMTHLAGAGASVLHEADEAARLGIPGEQLATLLALGGDFDAADDRIRNAAPSSSEKLLHAAVAAWRRGDTEGARSRFAALMARPEADYSTFSRLALAEIALAEGRAADAVPLLEAYARTPVVAIRFGVPPPETFRFSAADYQRSFGYPRSLYLMALAHHRLGHRERARAAVEHLLRLWKHADPAEPLLADAVALRDSALAAAR